VSRGRSNACNPLAPRIDKNLGNLMVKKCRSVCLQIVGGYIFYQSTVVHMIFGGISGKTLPAAQEAHPTRSLQR
jgi:hypothetical protein